MLGRLTAVLSGLTLFACSAVGVRDTEEPKFSLVGNVGAIEIRQYGPRVAAETVVDGSELQARREGFERLAGYIFGGNHRGDKIAMTAPVAQQGSGDRIAMTAPVAQTRDESGQWRIRFFMPANETMASLPQPNDARVHLVTVSPQTMAVLRFSGVAGREAVASRTSELMRALDGSAWRAVGTPVAWFYDPPWTLPPLRRNEVAVAVEHT